MLVTILLAILNWTIFRGGWKSVLIAFFFAILDVVTGSGFQTLKSICFDCFLILSNGMWFSEQELLWFYAAKSRQVHLCIVLFMLATFNGYTFLSLTILRLPFALFILFMNESFTTFDILGYVNICVMIYHPTYYTMFLFKVPLKILFVPSASVTEILYGSVYELLAMIIGTMLGFDYWCDDEISSVELFSNLKRSYFPICSNCKQILSGREWCQNCVKKFFTGNLSKWTSDNKIIDEIIKETQLKAGSKLEFIEWIPYNDFEDIKEIGKGNFGTVYSAIWKNGPLTAMLNGKLQRHARKSVAIKRFNYSTNVTQEFLRELKVHIRCSTSYKLFSLGVISCYGLSQDPITKAYILVMDLGFNGDLLQYLQKKFSTLKWKDKLMLLSTIIIGLKMIHGAGLIHRDFHTGNILIRQENIAYIADLGLSCATDEESSESGLYGVLPFVAPEVLRGYKYTAASDIYSFGMIMWVLISGQNPFFDSEYDLSLTIRICDGERPSITVEEIPECYLDLMEKCWNTNPSERPSVIELEKTVRRWCFESARSDNEFTQADNIQIPTKIVKEPKRISQFIRFYEDSEPLIVNNTDLLSESSGNYSKDLDENYLMIK